MSLVGIKPFIVEGVLYRNMEIHDIHAAAECFANSFQREPMVQSLGITAGEFMPFAEQCCEQATQDGMGLVAVDELTNKIAGFTILQDALAEMPEDIFVNHRNMLPIFEILEQLQNKYIAEKELTQQGEVVVSFVTGVNEEYQGTKIAFFLFGQSLELAKSKGYKNKITLVTGRLSQNGVRRRYSFTPYASVFYHDFQFEGKHVFKSIDDKNLSCVLMEKCLLN